MHGITFTLTKAQHIQYTHYTEFYKGVFLACACSYMHTYVYTVDMYKINKYRRKMLLVSGSWFPSNWYLAQSLTHHITTSACWSCRKKSIWLVVLLYPRIPPGTLKGTVEEYVQGLVTDGGGCPNSKLFGLVDRHTAGCVEPNWLFIASKKPRRCFSSPLWFCV